MLQLKEKILGVLKESTVPLGIMEIGEKAGIKNGNTTRANCLELVAENRIKYLKTSTGIWLFYDKDVRIEG